MKKVSLALALFSIASLFFLAYRFVFFGIAVSEGQGGVAVSMVLFSFALTILSGVTKL